MLPLTPLRTLRRLAAQPNFTRVAEELHLTQPAVTQHVRALTAHFGVALVERDGRRTALTDAGRFLAERAEPILAAVAALERDMREFAAAQAGELRLGASETIGNYVLPGVLATFARRHPGVRLDVEVANTTEIVARLRAGALTFALVEGDVDGDDLAIASFAGDELVVIVPVTHRLAGRVVVDRSDVRGEAFVSRERGSGTRALFESTMRDAQIEPRVVAEFPSGEAVVRAVAAGIGIAVVSRLVSDDARARGRVAEVAIDGVTFRRTFKIAHLARQTLSPAARYFLANTLGSTVASSA